MNRPIRIMLVDDEPVFLYHLKEIVTERCERIGCSAEFVAECYDAEEALSLLEEAAPDLIFTDIRMSGMDGLQLAQAIHDKQPQITVIIVSGYPSFDYARTALRAQVADYLIKPIEREAVDDILRETLKQMKEQTYLQLRNVVQSYIEDGQHERPGFPGAIGLLAANSRDMHFNPLLYDNLLLSGSEHLESLTPHLGSGENIWVFPGTNKRGLLFVCSLERCGRDRLIDFGQRLLSRYSKSDAFSIVAVCGPLDGPSKIGRAARELSRRIDSRQVIGRSILVPPEEGDGPSGFIGRWPTDAQEKMLEYKIRRGEWTGFREAVLRLCEQWDNEACPSEFAEMVLRKIAETARANEETPQPLARLKTEAAIRDLLYASSGYAEAGEAFSDWLQSAVKPTGSSSEKKSEALFNRILQYIAARLDEPLGLPTLTEEFGISSTYLCNLFRIYKGCSFVEYLTELRVSKSMELLAMQPEIPIKDIADIVGYADRHYFSKVFKASVGLTPTEYRSSC
ncbi:response regulator transcription factor [Cohnella hongkongensis]|uniref:Response regulator n=1 Tax=Cohnella hongkongensis TaxID=178337 RepID=A0ABV9FFY9_9BACL